ncbi:MULTISPECIES: hypothetical protein [unclassified Lentimonas]|uniref:hypothetical protein n=1 Tax=unclassified Lentimonas TaxID=2630993 RepID=UPI0013287DC5|nr:MULTISPECIES: hypothetical protein [unclassified Lentimonas]CAA6692406.1 Unannotated [Lentimonas sp. CC19]CAA6693989.1 Unannotated [Lentimonas sp. CC10]CAA7072224.1 Unannotated [Lentimonas sp. CC11]
MFHTLSLRNTFQRVSFVAPFFLYYCSQAVHVQHTPAKELDGVTVSLAALVSGLHLTDSTYA